MIKRKLLLTASQVIPPSIRNILIVLFYKRPKYSEDGIVTFHKPNFYESPSFKKARSVSLQKTGHKGTIDWRLHTVLWAAKNCSMLDGDFVECGTDTGFLARAIVQYIGFEKLSKKFYLVDTFEGIPTEFATNEERKHNYHIKDNSYKGTVESVKKAFRNYPNIVIVKGIIPHILKKVGAKKIAFMSIDLNNAYPEIESAKFFWDKLVPGAMIVLDDYSYSDTYEVQRQEWDKLAKKMNFEILTLPTGQGLIVK